MFHREDVWDNPTQHILKISVVGVVFADEQMQVIIVFHYIAKLLYKSVSACESLQCEQGQFKHLHSFYNTSIGPFEFFSPRVNNAAL